VEDFYDSLLVEPGMRVGISGGSTCTHLARLLRGSPVEVVTNAVNVAVELYSYPKTRVHVLGGSSTLTPTSSWGLGPSRPPQRWS